MNVHDDLNKFSSIEIFNIYINLVYNQFSIKLTSSYIYWQEAYDAVSFSLQKPWWNSWWFVVFCFLLAALIGAYILRYRNEKIQQKQEELETEQAINYLTSSIFDQSTVDDILWDVAKNCISRLNFEDCVIYLKDENRDVFLQKAAWGPKAKDDNKILSPLEIPMGKGIVGSVAKSGKAEIVQDISKDDRYIEDDERRSSEIAVPILYKGQVIGIIDSEHSKKRFFNKKHLSILTTIASLCGNKIMRLRAEDEARHAQLALLKHEKKTAEAQLKSLRLQMNPHFLFNSLNSLQQMILAGENNFATIYLSKFSRLLRLVLFHSDKDLVILKEELETLNLYIELEALRFKDAFEYSISCDPSIDPEEIKIPTMLIQPFVENAIWHGLMHKKVDRCLKIHFSETKAGNLICTIEDNGIGRKEAKKISQLNHTGKGISVSEERLKTYNEQYSQKSSVKIEDIIRKNGSVGGTRVTLILPLL